MVYPTELEHAGLYVALHASGLSETWNASHRMARPLLGGDPCQLSMGLQLAAYRTFAEAVSLLLKEETGQIQISARCGRYKGTRGIVLNIALLDRHRTLAPRTMERAIDRLSARAHAYSGSVQCRGHRITMVLLDSAGEAGRETVPNERNDICAAPARN